MKLNFKALFGSNFGKLEGNLGVVFTIKGAGIRTADGQVAVLNRETKEITLVPADLALGDFPAYAVPSKEVAVGDLVVQNNAVKFVVGKEDNGTILVINYKNQAVETITPTKTLLGYAAVSKVITPFGDVFGALGTDGGAAIDEKTIMMMAMMGDEDSDLGSMLPLMLMGGGGLDMSNPLMMMMLMGDGDDDNMSKMLPFLLMGKDGLGGKDGGLNPLVLMMLMKNL